MPLSFMRGRSKKRSKTTIVKSESPTEACEAGAGKGSAKTQTALSGGPRFTLPHSRQQQMNLLLGNERDWCSKSEETFVFRKRLRESRSFDEAHIEAHHRDVLGSVLEEQRAPSLDSEHRLLSQLQRFAELCAPSQLTYVYTEDKARTTGIIKLLRIVLHTEHLNHSSPITLTKTVSVNTNHSVNHIIHRFIDESLNETYDTNLDRTDFILRYSPPQDKLPHQSAPDLLFGETPLKFFKCIYNEKISTLHLIKKYSVMGLTEHDWRIKGITYSFDQHSQHNPPNSSPSSQPSGLDWYSHESLAFNSMDWFEMQHISLWDLGSPFRLCIRGVDTIPVTELFAHHLKESAGGISTEDLGLYMCVELLHGAFKLAPKRYTTMLPYSNAPRFNEWLEFDDLMLCCIPKETKICFTLYCRPYDKEYDVNDMNYGSGSHKKKEKDYPIAMVCSNLIDHKNIMRSGLVTARMWLDEAAGATQTCAENLSDDITLPPTVLSFELPEYALPVMFPSGEPPQRLMADLMQYEKVQTLKFGKLARSAVDGEIQRLLHTDPLYKMKDSEKWNIWMNRESLKSNPEALCKFLLSVPWDQPYAVHMAHQLLEEWEDLDPIAALELLDYNYPDSRVRGYALSRLNQLPDEELAPFLLQLVQTLKYELTHDSALARFLLQRGLRNTSSIGHFLYWHLASELHLPSIRERHGLILEEYLKNCGSHLEDLTKQKYVLDDLSRIACRIKDKELKGIDSKVEYVRAELEQANSLHTWPEEFLLPLDPSLRVCGIRPEKCKVMSSKKLPLWLVFKNADPEGKDIYVIFKEGDDLRQDLLTLQLLRIMDNLWKKEDLDLHMKPYGCVCTGDETGMIEVVLNSDTVANITAERGGASAAFSKDPLEKWLRKYNPTAEEYSACVDNFVFSCAGYCCATYVLGVGDRHNDNIMLQKNGDLFHIDFGHVLNNRKYFAGFIARETTPFVFTPMYAEVLGGKGSEKFKEFMRCGAQAFNILRSNAHLLMTLFLLMLGSGLPELQSAKDVEWLRNCMWLDKSEEEATESFGNLVYESLKNTRVKLNEMIHIAKHKGSLF